MFKEWDFLLAEIWGLLALAALVGLIAGWLIWGGRRKATETLGADADEVRRLRSELDRADAQNRADLNDPLDDVPPMQGGGYARPVPTAAPALQPTPQPMRQPMLTPTPPPQAEPVPEPEPVPDMAKPDALKEPRDGLPDDLTRIKGIGTKLQTLCNDLGFWHYDQIANWTAAEIAWVDQNLKGFKGRVTRDNWVEQARALARNDTPAR